MTELRKRLAEEWIIDFNAQKAGERAGIQGDNIRITAWQILQDPEVQEYIHALQAKAAERCEIKLDDWLNEWKKLGFSKITDYVENDYSAKVLSEVDNPEAIKSVKTTTIETPVNTIVTTEVVLHDKVNALVNIGKHLGFYAINNAQLKPEATKQITVTIVKPTDE